MERQIFDPPFRLVDTLILASLKRSPRHGYELRSHVVNISMGRLVSGNSTVYKAVKRLVGEGLVVPLARSGNDRRQFYDITAAGLGQLGRDLALLRRFLQAFDMRL
jgi:DNA-binding PadR family transcriptional regulator